MKRFFAIWGILVMFSGIAVGLRYSEEHSVILPPDKQSLWVDSVFATLSPDERIAQLIMLAAYSNKSLAENQTVSDAVTKYNVGGIIFFQGGPLAQAKLTNYWQKQAKTPLFISIDGEWGLGMRLKDSTLSYPRQLMLGAITDNQLIYDMGAEIARQCIRMGIHINFSPVVDVNNNPRNPVINSRSFGELRENVALKGIAYMKGMQDNGVLANAKHFPGHGDTDKDSHHTLPVIKHDRRMMDSIDLYPFRELMRNGLASVMVAHLNIPAYDTSRKIPSTFSQHVVTGLLKQQLNFQGLIITDALNMKGATLSADAGEIGVKALEAGNDILLMPGDVPLTMQAIKDAVKSGRLSQEELDGRCRKVLAYKYKAGLYRMQKVELKGLYEDLNTSYAGWINRKLCEASATLLKNEQSLIPLVATDTLKIATVSIGHKSKTRFQQGMDHFSDIMHFNLRKDYSQTELNSLLDKLKPFNLVIVGMHSAAQNPPDNFGVDNAMLSALDSISKRKHCILAWFANPYSLAALKNHGNIQCIIASYMDMGEAQQAAAAGIFGGIAFSGKLPVSVSADFPVNTGITTTKTRLNYSVPEASGLASADMAVIDSIALAGVTGEIYPGCQVLIALDGNVIHNRSYGWHTYEKLIPVTENSIYDLASLTKILATTAAIMKLTEEGKLNLDEKISRWLSELDSTNKENIILRKLMAHEAGLKAWIPFYKRLINNGELDTAIFSRDQSGKFPFRVAENLYICWDYPDTVYEQIIQSELRSNDDYRYSDLGFMLMMRVIERLTGQAFDTYVERYFYRPMGLRTMCFYPRDRFPLNTIVPSELDTFFRKQVIHGDVNDPGAALCGGIGGHAGLFSNARDVAVFMQMLVNGGVYGGRQYFKPETIAEFTRYQYKNNRRGAGFDKPVPDRKSGPTCEQVSDSSFGHSGFTGTYTWADPKYNLVYVFLSNRTYPYSEPNKLLESGIRTSIQQVIYKLILERNKRR